MWLPTRFITYLLLALFCSGFVSGAEHFDIKVHYRPLQNALLEKINGANASETLDTVQKLLITKFTDVLQVGRIHLSIYDFTLVGDTLKRPTLIVHAELSLADNLGRNEIAKRLAAQTDEHRLLIPYLRQLETPTFKQPAVNLHKLLKKPEDKPNDPVTACANGGILLPNATCSCDSYFGGADCSILMCMHQGLTIDSTTDSTRCLCPPGWVGRHCETLPTLPSAENSFDFSSRTLVLVLNNIISTTFDIQQTLFAISDYFGKAPAERQNFYKNYILLTFVQQGEKYIETQVESSTYTDFINQVASVNPLEGDDTQPILTATQHAINQLHTTLPKSTVVVVVDHLASDSSVDTNSETSQTLETALLKNAIYWQHSINVIITERSNEQRADDPGDPYNSLKRLSQRSNGELVDLGKVKSNVKQAVTALLQAQFKAETIAVQRDVDFSNPLSFQLATSKSIQLYVSGKNFQLKDSTSDALINPTIDAGFFALYSLPNSQNSLKLVAGQDASSKISYRAVIEADKQIFVGYTSNIEADASSIYPVNGIPHYAVLNCPPELASSQVSGVSASNSNNVVFTASDLDARTTASNFPFIAKATIDCPLGPFFTKVKFNNEQILISNFCFDPDHHNAEDHANSCNGKGVWNKEKNKCVCKQFYDGPNCEITLCQNGGTINDFPGNGQPVCFCPDGVSGDFCEKMSCTAQAEKPDHSKKSLSVVMQRSYSQAFLNPEIREAVKNALDSIDKKQEGYFNDLILTTFVKAMVGSDEEIQTKKFTKGEDLVDALSAANMKYMITSDTEQNSLQALLDTLKLTEVANEQNRLVLLFVDAPPKKPELIAEIKNIAFHQSISFNIIVTAPFGLDGSGQCMGNDFVELYKDLSRTTSGLFFQLCQTFAVGSVRDFVGGFLGASYQYQIARRQTSKDCNANVPVKIGDQTDMRYFLVDADQSTTFTVSLQNSDGQAVTLTQIGKLDTVILFQASGLEQKEYQLKVTVANPTICRITVAQENDFLVDIRFTPNPSEDAPKDTVMFGYQMHPVAYLPTQLQSTAQIDLTVDDESQYNNVAVVRNENCLFEYYFLESFSCSSNGGPFNLQLIITNADGVYIERSLSSYCEKLDVDCLNGGTYSDSKCHCPEGKFTGDYCEKPVCINGRAVEGKCECSAGYSGQFCENLMCTAWDFLSTHDNNKFEYNVQNANEQLIAGIKQYVDSVSKATTQMKHYSLITFNDKIVENVINTVDTNVFVDTFIDKLKNPTNSTKTSKTVQALSAMLVSTQINIYRPAIVYIFTNTGTSVGDPIEMMEALTLGGAQLNIFVTNERGVTSGTTIYYKQVITSSNGRYVWLKPDNVLPLLTDYLPTTVFENALILDESGRDCSKESTYSFPVESRIKTLTVIARGVGISQNIKIADESGNDLNVKVIYSDQGSYVATVDESGGGGNKKLTIKTTRGECSVQVRANSELHSEIGFTLDIHDDYPNERPTIVSAHNGSTFITVKIGKSFISTVDVIPTHVKLLSRDVQTGNNKLLTESDLYPRDSKRCANQYVSKLMDVPPADYKEDQTPLFVQISGTEGDTESFQRLKLYWPEPIVCLNGAASDQFGYCGCPSTYKGDDCSIPNCQNEGIVDLTVCACKSGYYGTNCDRSVL